LVFDGEISKSGIAFGAWAAFLALASLVESRRNPRPPRERYLRDPNGASFVAFWNILDCQKWTAEGLRFHRHRLQYTVVVTVVTIAWYLLADALW
jgi:hypothetical protein